MPSKAAEYWIKHLQLANHPEESFAETDRAGLTGLFPQQAALISRMTRS